MRGYKNAHKDISTEFLRSVLDYNPQNGFFTWKVSFGRKKAGAKAGFLQHKGRIKIGIKNKEYMAHRLAWLFMTGKWPEYEIDHINMNQSDNRWQNLRQATSMENHYNKGAPANNTSGYKGVCYHKNGKCFVAYITYKRKTWHLGCFKTAEEAFQAYCEAARKYHGEFSKY